MRIVTSSELEVLNNYRYCRKRIPRYRFLKQKRLKLDKVRIQIRDNLLQLFNAFTGTAFLNHIHFSKNQYILMKTLYTTILDRGIRSYQVFSVPYKVLASCVEIVDPGFYEDLVTEPKEDSKVDGL